MPLFVVCEGSVKTGGVYYSLGNIFELNDDADILALTQRGTIRMYEPAHPDSLPNIIKRWDMVRALAALGKQYTRKDTNVALYREIKRAYSENPVATLRALVEASRAV
jgi:hypothetical protein